MPLLCNLLPQLLQKSVGLRNAVEIAGGFQR